MELFFMPVAVFLTASYLQKNEGNVSVNIVSKRFSGTTKKVIRVVSFAATLGIYAWVSQLAAVQAWEGYLAGQVTTGVINFPTYLSWAVMSVGFALFCWRLLIQIAADGRVLITGEIPERSADEEVKEETEVPFQVISGTGLVNGGVQERQAEDGEGDREEEEW